MDQRENILLKNLSKYFNNIYLYIFIKIAVDCRIGFVRIYSRVHTFIDGGTSNALGVI